VAGDFRVIQLLDVTTYYHFADDCHYAYHSYLMMMRLMNVCSVVHFDHAFVDVVVAAKLDHLLFPLFDPFQYHFPLCVPAMMTILLLWLLGG
jgi:hypothetical protein